MKVSQLALSKAAAARQKEAAKQQQRDGAGSDSDEDMLEGSDADSDEGAVPTVAACLLAPHLLAVGAARPCSMRAAQVAGPEMPGWTLLFAMSACPGGCWGAAQLIRAQRVVIHSRTGQRSVRRAPCDASQGPACVLPLSLTPLRQSQRPAEGEEETAQLHIRKVAHTGGINRVRACPQQAHIVASWADTAQVQVGRRQGLRGDAGQGLRGARPRGHMLGASSVLPVLGAKPQATKARVPMWWPNWLLNAPGGHSFLAGLGPGGPAE